MDKFFAVFGKIILMALVGGGLLGAGYYLAMNSGMKLGNSANPQMQTEATLEPTPTIQSGKTITAGLPASSKLSFSQYIIFVPTGWTDNEEKDESVPTDKLILTKGSYSITIFQGATGGAQCVYPGEPTPEGPAGIFTSYTEFSGNGITYRRGIVDSSKIASQSFGVCAKTNANFGFGQPTPYGHIAYSTPKTFDQAILAEMDSIVASLAKVQ